MNLGSVAVNNTIKFRNMGDALRQYVTSLIQSNGEIGSTTITDLKDNVWNISTNGVVSIYENSLFPENKAIRMTGGTTGHIFKYHNLSGGNFSIEMAVSLTGWVSNGYAFPLIQYGTSDEGADGFAASIFSSSATVKRIYLRRAYSLIVSVDIPTSLLGTVVHIGFHYIDGLMYVSLNGQKWSAGLSGVNIGTGEKLLRVGHHTGRWLKPQTFYLNSLRITQRVTRYSGPYTAPSLPFKE